MKLILITTFLCSFLACFEEYKIAEFKQINCIDMKLEYNALLNQYQIQNQILIKQDSLIKIKNIKK